MAIALATAFSDIAEIKHKVTNIERNQERILANQERWQLIDQMRAETLDMLAQRCLPIHDEDVADTPEDDQERLQLIELMHGQAQHILAQRDEEIA
jgi:hypothetical protein